jgi:hypothetical protein
MIPSCLTGENLSRANLTDVARSHDTFGNTVARPISNIIIAPIATQAPAANVRPGPPMTQSAPAAALAMNVATPVARSKIAKAVPRRSSGKPQVGHVGADHDQVEVGLVHPGSKIDGIDDALLSDNASNRFQIIDRLKGEFGLRYAFNRQGACFRPQQFDPSQMFF